MRQFGTVFLFYLKEGFRSKAIMITAAILFLGTIGVFGIGKLTNGDGEKDKIAYVAESPLYQLDLQGLEKQLAHVEFSKAEPTEAAIEKGELAGILRVEEKQGRPEISYTYKSFRDDQLIAVAAQAVQQKYLERVIAETNTSPETAGKLLTPPKVQDKVLQDTMSTMGVVYIFTFLMYVLIISFGSGVATSIAAEKSSRVMDILVPKVRPILLMYSKVLANLCTGLFQLAVLAAAYGLSVLLKLAKPDRLSIFSMKIDVDRLTPAVIIAFVLYFALGYLVYAMLYAAIGAMVSKTEDIASASFPVTALMVGALFIGMKAMTDAKATIVVVGSYIPFFTPTTMFARVVSGEAAVWEVVVTLLLLLVTLGILNTFAGRVYKNGVLNYSEKVQWKDLLRFARKQ
ncbi:ABC transporter permease [Ectobacillus ponti]|uniref:ABC transporter permease n=1 Tax=Ectobacillus ponti TaxID=2961894 RepID=A0AA41X4U0_9BACI|nr:ABC transporter permease [Ectobacillus ponti]MCP8967203.1 ABC transporter permease [Ectobacillus ponti]